MKTINKFPPATPHRHRGAPSFFIRKKISSESHKCNQNYVDMELMNHKNSSSRSPSIIFARQTAKKISFLSRGVASWDESKPFFTLFLCVFFQHDHTAS